MIIEFQKDIVKAYIDEKIEYWRKNRSDYAHHYINAYQNIRMSLFGEHNKNFSTNKLLYRIKFIVKAIGSDMLALPIARFFRDRLRCPKCKAIGTFKPYGGLFDRLFYTFTPSRKMKKHGRPFKKRLRTFFNHKVRFVCKWCGYFEGWHGIEDCCINIESGVWDFKKNHDDYLIPKDMMHEKYLEQTGQKEKAKKMPNPWYG